MNLTDLYNVMEEQEVVQHDDELEKQAQEEALIKVAEEYVTAGRIMAHGYYDEMEKYAGFKENLMKRMSQVGDFAKKTGKSISEGSKAAWEGTKGAFKDPKAFGQKMKEGAKETGRKIKKAYSLDTLKGQLGGGSAGISLGVGGKKSVPVGEFGFVTKRLASGKPVKRIATKTQDMTKMERAKHIAGGVGQYGKVGAKVGIPAAAIGYGGYKAAGGGKDKKKKRR